MVNVQGTIPAPLNYAPPGHRPYPKSICTSVNHQVCHGVPGEKMLKHGDIVNIDITVIKDGWHGDTSRMFYVGEPSIQAKRLCESHLRMHVARHRAGAPGRDLGDIGARDPEARREQGLQRRARILRARHRQALPRGAAGPALRPSPARASRCPPGMIFTVEPMINAGRRDIRQMDDGWTIVTARPQPLGAVGAHGARHRRRLRGPHGLDGRARRRRRSWPSASRLPLNPAALERHRRPRRALARRRAPRSGSRRALRAWLRARAKLRRALPASAPIRSACSRPTRRYVDAAAAEALGRVHRRPGPSRWWRSAATAAATLFPHSDVDVLVLLPDGRAADAAIERFVGALWDCGLEPGPQRAHRLRVRRRSGQGRDRRHQPARGAPHRRQRRRWCEELTARLRAAAQACATSSRPRSRSRCAATSASRTPPTTSSPTSRKAPGACATCTWCSGSRAPPASARSWKELAEQGLITPREADGHRHQRARAAGPAHPPALPRRPARGPPRLRPPDRDRAAAEADGHEGARRLGPADAPLLPRGQGDLALQHDPARQPRWRACAPRSERKTRKLDDDFRVVDQLARPARRDALRARTRA